MDRQEELFKFLQSKGLYEGVDLQRFKRGLLDESKAQALFEAMKSDGSLGADIDYDYWKEYHNIPAAQKKSQAKIQAGLGGETLQRVSPLSSGVDFTAPIQDVARQATQIQAEQQPVQPQQPVEPPRVEQRMFGGRQIPSPVALGKEEEALTMESIASRQRMEALQKGGAIVGEAMPRQAIGQVESDFPIKSAQTAIKELEDARKQRQEEQRPRTKAEEFVLGRGEAAVPVPEKVQNFFKDTRLGRIITSNVRQAGATTAKFGAGVLNIPELVGNTIENIALDAASAPLRKQLQEGKITQEQFKAYTNAAREANRRAQMATPTFTPRKIEYLADTYLNADQLEDDARKNLQEVNSRIANAEKGFEGLISEGRYTDAFEYAASNIGQMLPYGIAAAIPGGLVLIGAETAQDKYRSIEDQVGAENMRSKETLNAILTGATEAISEGVTKKLLENALRLIKAGGKVNAFNGIKNQALNLFLRMFGDFNKEGFSEFAAKLAENIIDKLTIDPKKNLKEGLIESYAVGGVGGGVITGTAGAIGLAMGAQPEAGAAAPTPTTPGAPTTPTAPTPPQRRPFGPLGESAPDANVYADEILGNYRPEAGQLTQAEAGQMVQDYLRTFEQVDDQTDTIAPPTTGWEASVYNDITSRQDEIVQAVIDLAATPKPTRAEAVEPTAAAQPTAEQPAVTRPTEVVTPQVERFAQDIYNIFGGQELTEEEANNNVDEYLNSLVTVNERGENVYAPEYQDVLINGEKIARKIVELSKQPTDATQEVEQMQPEGGQRQYPGTQEVGQEAPTEADLGNRPVVSGVQPQAEVAAGVTPAVEGVTPTVVPTAEALMTETPPIVAPTVEAPPAPAVEMAAPTPTIVTLTPTPQPVTTPDVAVGETVALEAVAVEPVTPQVETIPQVDATDNPTEASAQSIGIQPKGFRDLYLANRDVFGLDRVKSFANAIAMDRMVGQMAKRANVSKDEIYSKLNFKKSQEELLKQKPGVLFQIDAWHGSSYLFDKFSTEFIGKGEGAQAFGWGLYFTELEDVANWYAEKLSESKQSTFEILSTNNIPEQQIKNVQKEITEVLGDDIFFKLYYDKLKTKSKDDAINNLKAKKELLNNQLNKIADSYVDYTVFYTFLPSGMRDNLRLTSQQIKDKIKNIDIALDAINNNEVKFNFQEKRIYKAKLFKGKTTNEYNLLEWDSPADKYNWLLDKLSEEQRLENFPDGILPNETGKDLYNKLANIFNPKEASIFLLSNGIDGIKYPAESRSKKTKKPRGYNYVVFDDNAVSIEDVIKFQKDAVAARGAAIVAMDGQATIYALTNPNVSTPLHELAHVYEHYMTDAERKTVVDAAGTQGWTTETSEYFSRGFERYLAEGVAPNTALQKLFDKFKQWLTDIYNGIKDSAIDVQLNDEMRRIYAQMLGVETIPARPAIAEPIPQQTPVPTSVAQTGTLQSPHVDSVAGGRKNSQFLDANVASGDDLDTFFNAGGKPELKERIRRLSQIAKKLKKVADLLGVKIYFGKPSAFDSSIRGMIKLHRASSSDPLQKAIYINIESAKDSTIAHELAHAFFANQFAANAAKMTNEQLTKANEKLKTEARKLQKRITTILEATGDKELQDLAASVNEFASTYVSKKTGEEFVVELAARLNEGLRNKIVDNSVLAKLERAINAFFDAIFGAGQLQVRLTDTTDLIDFLNTLSRGVTDGDAQSIEEALTLYESGRVNNPRKTVYWKKQEIENGQTFVKNLVSKINAKKDFNVVKDVESIVNKILAQTFSPGKYVVKFDSAKDAAGFVEKLDIGLTHVKDAIKVSKDVAADMMVAINDYFDTIIISKQQIATDLTANEMADMEKFTENFPPVGGLTPEPTGDERRVIEKLQQEQDKGREVFGKMINTVTVSDAANQDAIADKPKETKMRMIQDRTGAIPNGLAGELAVDNSPHGLYNMFQTILGKIQALQRDSVTPLEAARAIFAQGFDGKKVHAFAMFDKVRIMDPALITTEKEASKEYYMFDGSGAASILLNSELGQTFLQDLSEGRRNTDFEAQAAEVIALYGVDPVQFFDRIYAAQAAFNEGGINAAEKSLNNGRSLAAAITGVGTLTKQEAKEMETAIAQRGILPVKTTGNERLDSRADAMALALNMDRGMARTILYHLVGKHLTNPLDHNAVDDAIDLSDMEFYPQLSMLTDSDYDNGFEIISQQRVGTGNMHNYTSQPYYDAAKDYVMRELGKGTSDKDIVKALSQMYPAHLSGFDGKNFFEGIAARRFASDTGFDDVSAGVFRFFRHVFRAQWGDAKMELSAGKEFTRNTAYSFDYSIGNDLAFVRKAQRDVEKYLRHLLPKESAAYQKMQLYTSAAAFKLNEFTNSFYGDKKALREGKFTDSFISRLTRSAVGGVAEFNTFLVNIHRWERIDRAIDIQEKFLTRMYQELVDLAEAQGITLQPITTGATPATMAAQVDFLTATTQIVFLQKELQRLKVPVSTSKTLNLKGTRFLQEHQQYVNAINLRDGVNGIVSQFRNYVKSKGVDPTGKRPQDLETIPEFADHFNFYKEFKAMQIKYLDILLDAGHLNDERYQHLKDGTSSESDVIWNYYSPLIYDEFAFRDEMGFPVTSAERKVSTFKILGLAKLRRKRAAAPSVMTKKPITIGMLNLENLESPVEVFFHRMSSAIKFKERNDAMNALANMLEQTGSDKYANFAARYSVQKDRWGTVTSANDLIPDSVKNQSVTYYKDGKRRYLFFADPNDPILAKVNKGYTEFTEWEQMWRYINNFTRAAFTYLNPGFIEASLFRDVLEAGTNIMVESRGVQLNNFKTKLAKNFIKYYGKSSKFFLDPMFAKDPEMAMFFREIQEVGGFMAWSYDSMELLQDAEAKVKDNIAYAEQYAQGRTKMESLKTLFTNSFDALTALSNRVEMMPRLATYASLRKMDIDPIRAAEAAKNITVNFEKKGASKNIQRLSMYFLFLNPSIQGVRKFGKQLYSPEGRKYLLAYGAATAAVRGTLYMMPYLAGDDEEERQRISEKIDRYIYDKYIGDTKVLLPNPLDPENPLTAPKPYNGFRLASAIGEGMVDMYAGKKTSMDVTDNIRRQIKGAFDPIAGTSSYSNQFIDALPAPLLHPVFEAVANVDYQGRPILFDQSGAFDYLKANKGTAQVYHTIARNVFKHTPGHIDISPTSYEHVIESNFKLGPARIITNLVKAGNNLTDPESGKTDAERQKHFLKEIISANRVLYNPNISEDDKRDLYNYLSMASEKMGSWNEEKVKYAERAIIVTKQKMLVNPKVIQDSLDDLLSQVVQNGKLYQNVPGQEITWAQWYSAMSAIGDKRSSVQHKRYINDKIRKALEESGNEEQE